MRKLSMTVDRECGLQKGDTIMFSGGEIARVTSICMATWTITVNKPFWLKFRYKIYKKWQWIKQSIRDWIFSEYEDMFSVDIDGQ